MRNSQGINKPNIKDHSKILLEHGPWCNRISAPTYVKLAQLYYIGSYGPVHFDLLMYYNCTDIITNINCFETEIKCFVEIPFLNRSQNVTYIFSWTFINKNFSKTIFCG